jgi:site-specific recombinase XerD
MIRASRPFSGSFAYRSESPLQAIDLHWHDLRHEGACRLLADGVDIRIIQLMLGHASVQQTQRYLNVTDEELRKGLEVSWKRRTLKAVAGGQNA